MVKLLVFYFLTRLCICIFWFLLSVYRLVFFPYKLNNVPTFELVNIHILNFVSFNLTEPGGYRQGGLGR